MTATVEHLDPEIFTVADILTAEECARYIARGEELGFEAASVATSSGPQMMTNIRNNDRVTFDDEDLAAAMWERAARYVPAEIEGCRPVGLNPRFRFYRYDPGQRFKRHRDGRVKIGSDVESRVTFLIYLNEDYEGGETVFREYTFVEGAAVTHDIVVTPRTGTGLFFIHERMHEGSAITSGRKYVLRTDVLYGPA